MKTLAIFILFHIVYFNNHVYSQDYSIQIKVVDQITDLAIDKAIIMKDGKAIGFTNAKGEYIYKNCKKDDLYTFKILPSNYEAREYQIQASDSFTICNPVIKLRKLDYVKMQYFKLMIQNDSDTLLTNNLYKTICETYKLNKNTKEKSEFIKFDGALKGYLIALKRESKLDPNFQ